MVIAFWCALAYIAAGYLFVKLAIVGAGVNGTALDDDERGTLFLVWPFWLLLLLCVGVFWCADWFWNQVCRVVAKLSRWIGNHLK